MSLAPMAGLFATAFIVCSDLAVSATIGRQTLTVAEAPFDARLISIQADHSILLEHDGNTRKVALRDLVVWGSYIDQNRQPQLHLVNGGVLVGDILKVTPSQVTVYSRIFSEFAIPRSLLKAIVFEPPASPVSRDRFARQILSNAADHDEVQFTNGDVLRGAFAALPTAPKTDTLNRIGFQTRNRPIPFSIPLERLTALVLRRQESPPPQPAVRQGRPNRVALGFADGSRFEVDDIEANQQTIQLAIDQHLVLSANLKTFNNELTQIQPQNPRLTFLSDLTPASYKHIPFLQRVWPPGIDENVLGGRLRTAGTIYAKGIGMHSAARITFRLDHRFRWFRSELGLDDASENRGSVVFRVFLQRDGAWGSAYASPIVRGRSMPRTMNINVMQADAIALIVEFADRGDERDYANWLNARLVK